MGERCALAFHIVGYLPGQRQAASNCQQTGCRFLELSTLRPPTCSRPMERRIAATAHLAGADRMVDRLRLGPDIFAQLRLALSPAPHGSITLHLIAL
jgi:hypothetical protein